MTTTDVPTGSSATTVYRNAKVFTADPDRPLSPAFAVRDGCVLVVGCDEEVLATAARDAHGPVVERDLGGRLVLPGIVDAHFHLVSTGESLTRVDLVGAKSLDEIQAAVRRHADADPHADWVLGKAWLFSAVPGEPTAAMLDAVVPHRPVLLDALDYHSSWVNTEALRQIGVTDSTPDPAGGRIARDANGKATGFLEETAAEVLAWAHLERITTGGQRRAHLQEAIEALTASGITAVIDMGLGASDVEVISAAEREGWLDLRVVGHWLMSREGGTAQHLAEVSHAAGLAAMHTSDRFRVTGVKFIVDGVIDGCTAHLRDPYTNGSMPDPIWDYDALAPVVAAADAAGLQVAMHAIGDAAVAAALDAVENAYRENGTGPHNRRHRIEHIEYCDPADIPRFAQLGVTASMQPVHADPAIAENWRAMIGPERAAGGFPAAALVESGARLVLGTDAPTAPFAPLPNLYIATTRRSVLDPSLPPHEPKNALALEDAIAYATAHAAWSCHAEGRMGALVPGAHADFIVVDPDVIDADPEALLTAAVVETAVGGRTVHERA